jgi:predicted TIM-barrel fold metal-dependent hydrolase
MSTQSQSHVVIPGRPSMPQRVVALEEAIMDSALVEKHMGPQVLKMAVMTASLLKNLNDVGEGRIKNMDENGITVQVLSTTIPGAEELDGDAGVEFAKIMNNKLAQAVRAYPKRFAAFAGLPMRTPDLAADELHRAVSELGFRGALIYGTTKGKFLDDPVFAPILKRAEQLDVPIYLHPGLAPRSVYEAYFSGFSPGITEALSKAGYAWHHEVGLHVLRLALSGTLTRYPRLKLIIGHMGETLPFMLARADDVFQRVIRIGYSLFDLIVDRVHITTSGMFTNPPFLNALQVFGADRIMFSVDYPYGANEDGRRFLDGLSLSPSDMAKITHGNADRLLKLS